MFSGELVDQMPWVPRIDLWFNLFRGMQVERIHRVMGRPLHKIIPEFSGWKSPS